MTTSASDRGQSEPVTERRVSSPITCPGCGEDHFSPSVEAFEITGKLVCHDCADDAIILFEDAIEAEPDPYPAMFDGTAEYASQVRGGVR